jgi:hypothetical protein
MSSVKTLKFMGLSGNSDWSAINIRFYDSNNKMILTGAPTMASDNTGTFNILTCSKTNGWPGSNYYVTNAFNTNKMQKPNSYDDASYTILNSSGGNIYVTFINELNISKIEMNCAPGSYTNHITSNPFNIETYDNENKLIKIYTVIPIVNPRNSITTLLTPELCLKNKILFFNQNTQKILSYNKITNLYEEQQIVLQNINNLTDLNKSDLNICFNNANLQQLSDISSDKIPLIYFKMDNEKFKILIKK